MEPPENRTLTSLATFDAFMTTIEGAILDVDGTLVRGETVLPGATEGVTALVDAGISILLFSNNPTREAGYYREKLAGGGLNVDVPADRILTSGTVSATYLASEHPEDSIYVVGEDRLRSILRGRGLSVTEDPSAAEVVLGSIDRDLTYDELTAALDPLSREVPFYGTDPDTVIPGDSGDLPGSGTVLAALEAMAGREPDAIFGKPSPIAADMAAERLGTDPARTLVVGDRLDTDVALGRETGMRTALVETGIENRPAGGDRPEPEYVLESLAAVDRIVR